MRRRKNVILTPRERSQHVTSRRLLRFTILHQPTHLFLEVLQHVLAAAPQVGLQQDRVPLLVVHGLGDLAAQEPEEEVADAFALGEGEKAERIRRRGGTQFASTGSIHRFCPFIPERKARNTVGHVTI